MMADTIYDEDVMFFPPSGSAIMFRVISGQAIGKSKTIPTHKTEAGYEIADHMVRNPVKLTLTISLLHNNQGNNDDTNVDEVSVLESLEGIDTPITVVTSIGVFNNQMIQNIDYDKSQTPTSVKATVTLQEVRTSTAKTTSITLPTMPDSEIPGDSGGTTPQLVNNSSVTNGSLPPGLDFLWSLVKKKGT